MKIIKCLTRKFSNLQQKKEIWTKLASNMLWQKYPQEILPTVQNGMKWYQGGQLNIAENCLSKNVQNLGLKDSPAIYYHNFTNDKEGFVTYRQLNKRVLKFIDVLKHFGIVKGKKVLIYMPNIIETAEAVLACSAIGAIFESQHYGVGMIQLKECLQTFNPDLIITASCSVDQEGIHQNQIYINKARQDLNKESLKCLVIQRPEKKILELGKNDFDYSQIEIEEPSKYIKYENLDSNYPLYTFNTFLNIDDKIIQNRVYRETGPFAVGLNQSMLRTMGTFQQSKILCLAHLSSTLGLSYMLFGPLLRGASTFIIEDSWVFSKVAAEYIKENQIKIVYIHANLLQKILDVNKDFLKESRLQSVYTYGELSKKVKEYLFDCHKKIDKFFFTRTFYNTELGIIAGANDWTETTYDVDEQNIKKIDKLEYKLMANKNDQDELCLRIDSYPGIFTTFFDQQTQMKFQHYYFKDPMYLNTFLPVKIQDKNYFNILRRSEADSPYKLISGIKFIKKQIASDIQHQIKELKDLYFLPLQKDQQNDFVFFIELENCKSIIKDQEAYDKFYKNVQQIISSSIGDVFEIENIFFFDELPKKELNGKLKIDSERLRKLLDTDNKKILENDQEIFDFKKFEENIYQN